MVTLGLVMLNLRLYHHPSAAYGPDQLGPDVVPQLHFIGQALRAGAGQDMQSLFPEGYFFTHVLYGLSWVEVGLRSAAAPALYAEALREARWALAQLDSEAGRAPFSPSLTPPYGVFYAGWSNWLRGGVLKLQAAAERDPQEVRRFVTDSAALAAAFDRALDQGALFLEAYPKQAWPVDSVVALASLRLHDTLLPPRFESTLARWLEGAQRYTELPGAGGLLAHRVSAYTGQPEQFPRGTSQSLITRFLVEIDPEWGQRQYALFREQFVRPFLGVPGVVEYADRGGPGDVDSGPLVFGFSASATVNVIGAAQVNGDHEVADALIAASEAVGLPLSWGNEKRYALGLLPVGDAFLVWAKTARPWVAAPRAHLYPDRVAGWWRWPFHGLTLLLVLVMELPLRRFKDSASQRLSDPITQ